MFPRSKLSESDLRLVALALVAEVPQHGYEIIKTIEQTTAEWYLPSPNLVYPTLTSLAEAGYMTASADPPRLYTITDEGRAYLGENRVPADTVLNRLSALGERVRRWRHALKLDEQPESLDDSAEGFLDVLARVSNDRHTM